MSIIQDYNTDKIKNLSKQIDRFINEHPKDPNWVPNFPVPNILLEFNRQSDDDHSYRTAIEYSSKLLFLTDSDFNAIMILLQYLKDKYHMEREDLLSIFGLHTFLFTSNEMNEGNPDQNQILS